MHACMRVMRGRRADQYGGILRAQFLWQTGLMVTDPAALASICGRGPGALDKATAFYAPINYVCAGGAGKGRGGGRGTLSCAMGMHP